MRDGVRTFMSLQCTRKQWIVGSLRSRAFWGKRGIVAVRALIAIGSNLGAREQSVRLALAAIRTQVGEIVRESRWYCTRAMLDPQTQYVDGAEQYLNLVAVCETSQSPEQVLGELLQIERQLGRERGKGAGGARWMPRVIDLDLLGMESLVRGPWTHTPVPESKTPERSWPQKGEALALPHPELHQRDFVLVPLVEVAPDWVHPVLRRSAEQLLKDFESSGAERFVEGVFSQSES